MLPAICASDEDGTLSYPFLREFHSFICIEKSERVKRSMAEVAFVPTADSSESKTPRDFVSTAVGGAPAAFAGVLNDYVPVPWILDSKENQELLHALGMGSALSPSMILECA